MSSTRWPRAALLILVAITTPIGKSRAQDTRELARRVDSAQARLQRATNALVSYRRSIADARAYSDTIAIADGALVIITTHELLPLVRAGAAIADLGLRQRVGAADSLLRGTMLAVRTDSAHRVRSQVAVVRHLTTGESADRYEPAKPAAVASAIEDYAQATLLSLAPPTFREWLAVQLPVDTATDFNWMSVRLQLVTSRASVGHRCYAGDIAACKVTLGLALEPDPVTAWYDASARRGIIHDAQHSAVLDRAASARCLGGSDADCIALIRTSNYLVNVTASPVSPGVHSTLVQQAYASGGPGVLQRLLTNGTSPAERLSAAAKVPVDTLVAQWLRNVRTRGIASDTFRPRIALIAVVWILAIGALALVSPRWR